MLDWLARWRYEQRATIIVWAEFANLEGKDQPTADADAWLKRVEQAARPPLQMQPFYNDMTGIVNIHSQWTFMIKREYDKPYTKRTHLTRSTSLAGSGWVQDLVQRIDKGAAQYDGGLRIAIQFMALGGRRGAPPPPPPRELVWPCPSRRAHEAALSWGLPSCISSEAAALWAASGPWQHRCCAAPLASSNRRGCAPRLCRRRVARRPQVPIRHGRRSGPHSVQLAKRHHRHHGGRLLPRARGRGRGAGVGHRERGGFHGAGQQLLAGRGPALGVGVLPPPAGRV
jgi:hypothetical protein